MSNPSSAASTRSSENEKQQTQDAAPEAAPTTPSPPPPPDEVTGYKLWTIMAGITLTCFLMLLDTSILVTAIPQITSEFPGSLPYVGWYGAAYQLSSAVLQPLTGKVYANFDTKWTFVAFAVIFEIGSLLCGVAVSAEMLIVGRAVAGIGTSGIQNGAFTIIAGCVPMPKRPALIGFVMGVAQLGLVCGPLIGGALTQYTTWRWCFYINLPLGAIVGALLFFVHIPEQMQKPKPNAVVKDLHNKLDLIGFAIFAPAAIMLLLAVQYGGNQFAWDSSVVIGLFCGAGVTFILWVGWNWHKKDAALIPFSMVSKRPVWSSCMVYGLLMSSMFTTSYYLPIYFQGVLGASPTLSGVYLLPSILAQLFFAIGAGKLVGRLGYYLPFSLISAVFMSVGYGLLTTFTPETSTGNWIGYQILFGTGRGLGLQMPLVAVQNSVNPPQIPVAMALVMFASTLGGALFLAFSDTIFTNSLRSLIEQYAPDVNPEAVINAGARSFRSFLSPGDLADVLRAYAKSIDYVFYFITAAAVLTFGFAWGMGWKDIRKKAPPVSKA